MTETTRGRPPEMTDGKRVNLRLGRELRDLWDQTAEFLGQTKSEVARNALRYGLLFLQAKEGVDNMEDDG